MNCPQTAGRARRTSLASFVLAVLGTFLLGQPASATDGTWISNFGGAWDNSLNWSGGSVADGAASTANLNFDVVGGGQGITNPVSVSLDTASRTVGILNIGDLDATHKYTITTTGGFSLIFDNGGSNAQLNQVAGSAGDTILTPIILNSSLDITNASSATLTIGGITAGQGTISASGVAATISLLSGNTTFTSTAIISDGTGTIAVSKSGSGTLTLSAASTYSAGTTVSGGTLVIGSSSTVTGGTIINGPVGLGTLTLGDGTTLQSNNSTAKTLANAVSLSGNITLGATSGGTGTLTFNGNTVTNPGPNVMTLTGDTALTTNVAVTISDAIGELGGARSLTKAGAATLTLSGPTANTYTGLTTVNVGQLDLNKTAGINAIAGNLTIGDGTGTDTVRLVAANQIADTSVVTLTNAGSAVFNLNGLNETIGGLTDSTTGVSGASVQLGAGTLTFGDSTDRTFSGIISGTNGQLVKQGTGTQTLSGANTYTGATTISAGTLKLGVANAVPSGSALTDNATFDLNGFSDTVGSLAGTGTVTSGAAGAVTLTAGGNNTSTTFSGIIQNGSGTVALTKAGSGTLTLSGPNSYSGLTTVSAGILNIQNAAALGGTGTGTTVSSGATLQLQGGITFDPEALTISGTGAAGQNGALVNVSGTNNYSGLLTLGAATTISSDGSGTLNLTNTGTITGPTFGLTLTGTGNGSISSIIGTTTGTLTKSGTGTWTLFGANTYTGLTTVSAGTLKLGIGGSLSSGDALTTSGTAQFDINGNTQTLGLVNNGSTNANAITNSSGTAATLTIGNGSTGAGAFSGAMNLIWNQGATSSSLTGAFSNIGNITLNANGVGTIGLSAVNNTGTITNSGTGAGATTISGVIGTNVTGVIENSATSSLTLSGTNTFTGGLAVKKGTVILNNASAAGGGPITLGDSAGGSAFLLANSFTIANAINLGTSAAGILTLGNNGNGMAAIFSGAIGLNGNNLVIASSGNNAQASTTITGGITGTGNLTLNNNGAASSPLNITTTAVNNSGTITNSGTGNGTSTISGGVGSNVTGITENSATSALTISTTALTVNSGGTTLTNSNASGTSLLTLSGGVTGTGNLILNNNSSIANGITLSTTTVNNTGTIINSGTGSGVTLISAGVGANVTGITENSGTSALTVSGALTLSGGGTKTLTNSNSTGSSLLSITGGATGSGNLVLNNNSSITNGITLSGTSVNNTGTITNSGTGSGSTLISAVIGTNVTGVVENSATSQLNLSGTNLYTTGTTITSGTISVSNAAGLGTGAVTVNAGTLEIAGVAVTANNLTLNNGATLRGTGTSSFSKSGFPAIGAGASVTLATAALADVFTIGSAITGGNASSLITVNGPGTLVLSSGSTAAGAYAGSWLLNGTSTTILRLSDANALGNPGGSSQRPIDLRAGTLQLNISGNVTISTATTVSGDVTITPNGTTSNTYTMGTLSIGSNTLTETTGANYGANATGSLTFGATTLTGNPIFALNNVKGTATGVTTLGAINDGGTARTITKSGLGTLTLSSAATSLVDGTAVNITAGKLSSNNATALGSLANITLTLGVATTIFDIGASQTIGALNSTGTGAGSVTLNGNTLTIGSTNNLNSSFAGTISGTGGITKAGTGTLTLGAANGYTGLTLVSAGTLIEGVSNALSTGALTVDGATAVFDLGANHTDSVGTVTLDGGGSIIGTGTSALTSTGTFEMKSGSVSTALAGAVPLNKTTSGTVTLSGANTYTGLTTISAGILNIQSASALGGTGTGTTVASGAALELQGGISVGAEALSLTGTGVSGGGALRNISGNNTWGGLITLTGATRINSDANTLTIDVASGNAITGAHNLTIGGAGTVNIADPIATGSGTLTKDGTGTLIFSGGGANTYSGLTTVSAGILALNKADGTNAIIGDGAPNKGVNDILVNGGTLRWDQNNQLADSVTLSISSGTVNFNGKNETLYDLNNSGGTVIYGRGNVTITDPDWTTGGTNIVNGNTTFGLLNVSGGTNIITGENDVTYQGPGVLTVGGGGLTFKGTASPNITINSDSGIAGKLVLGGDVTVDSTVTAGTASITNSGGDTNPGQVDLGGVTRTFTVNNGSAPTDLSISAQIINGGLTKAGAGLLNLYGANTYSGGTTVNAGTLQVSSSGTFGASTGSLTVNTGGTVDLNGTSQNVGAINGSGGTVLNNAFSPPSTLTAGNGGANGSYAGVLADGGGVLAFTKVGTGTQILTGNNTYTGATTVTAGTLLINGSLAAGSSVTVANSGSVLGGSGTINGAVTIGTGAIGDTAAILGGDGTLNTTLTVNNSLTLSDNSIIQLALGPKVGLTGPHSTLARTGSGTWTFDSNQAFSFIDLGATRQTFYDNIITGLAVDPTITGWTIVNSGWLGTFSYENGNIDLTLSEVPEPGTWAGAALALAAMLYTQRRRLRKLITKA